MAYHQSDPFPQLPSNLRSLPATAHGSLPSLCSPLFFLIPLFPSSIFPNAPCSLFAPCPVGRVSSKLRCRPSPGHSYQPPLPVTCSSKTSSTWLYHVGGFFFHIHRFVAFLYTPLNNFSSSSSFLMEPTVHPTTDPSRKYKKQETSKGACFRPPANMQVLDPSKCSPR